MVLPAERLLNPESLAQYFALSARSVHRLTDRPLAELVIDPPSSELDLVVESLDDVSQPTRWRNIRVTRSLNSAGRIAVRIGLSAGGREFEVYSFLLSVLDSMASGSGVAEAIELSVTRYGDITAAIESPSRREALGLYGELLVLQHLMTSGHSGVDAWVAHDPEEHDFKLRKRDLEVKTTTRERREHHINSLTQLVPLPGRELAVVSVQLTAGGAGGKSLRQLISDIASTCAPTARAQFLSRVANRAREGAIVDEPFLLRSEILVARVDDDFPSITPVLVSSNPELSLALRELEYVLDLTPLMDTRGNDIDAEIGAAKE